MSVFRFVCLTAVVPILLVLVLPALAFSGDPTHGKELFVGSVSMENGGAPCLACHNLTGFGMASGANYGPDLSSLYENYGREGVEGVLQAVGSFPSMEAIYADRPLTETEQADLVAFLDQTSQLSATPSNGTLFLQVLLGVAVLFGLNLLVGLKRIKSVRKQLTSRLPHAINKGGIS